MRHFGRKSGGIYSHSIVCPGSGGLVFAGQRVVLFGNHGFWGANYDRAKTLRRMEEEEGLLVCDSGHRYTKQKWFRNAGRVYCVCIDNEALEAFLERAATGAGAAVIASQGGAPC